MTGFIKPETIHETQMWIVEQINGEDMSRGDVPEPVLDFLTLNPVTKETDGDYVRKVNGVYISEESYEDAPRLDRPLDVLEG